MFGKKREKMPLKSKVYYGTLLLCFLIMLFINSLPEVSEPAAPAPIADADLSNNAFIMCKRHVKAALTSPSTADFPFLDFQSVKISGQKYLVQSYVDSQNGFGAMVRTNWACVIEHDGVSDRHKGSSWTLIDLAER